jgi:hypothetical protein
LSIKNITKTRTGAPVAIENISGWLHPLIFIFIIRMELQKQIISQLQYGKINQHNIIIKFASGKELESARI